MGNLSDLFGLTHTGSWGTPELGITEKIGSWLGANKTAQGGSNITGSIQQAQAAPAQLQAQQNLATAQGGGFSNGTTTTPSLSNTGGGGGGSPSQLQQLEAIGTDRNPSQESEYQNLLKQMQGSAESQAQAELDAALGELDYAKENLQAQSGQLDTQRAGALSTLDTEYGKAEKEKGLAQTEATAATAEAKNRALSTANDVTKKNRNVLRALGILSSSAGGEILTKAMTEYGTQAGELQQGLIKRLATVEDWWMNRQQEFTKAKTDLETQYATLKENISRDLRFNDRQRLSAVKAAQAALSQRTSEIQNQAMAYQNVAKQYSDNILLKIAEMKMYQNPSADVSAIYNQLLSSAQGNTQPRQVGTALSEEERKKQSGTLSGLG